MSWHFTDLSANSVFQSVLAPLGLFVFLIELAMWLVFNAGFGRRLDDGGEWF